MQLRWYPSSILALSGALALILNGPIGTTLSAMAQEKSGPTQAAPVAIALTPVMQLRSPALLIDDLVEVAVHSSGASGPLSNGAQNPAAGAAGPNQAASSETRRSKSSAYQHVIPDVININYRPARAAAQIYMGHGSEDGAAKQLDQAKYKDEITVLITSIMLDLATGLGEKATNQHLQAGTIATAMARLSEIVGQQEAIWAFERLEKFSRSVKQTKTQSQEITSANVEAQRIAESGTEASSASGSASGPSPDSSAGSLPGSSSCSASGSSAGSDSSSGEEQNASAAITDGIEIPPKFRTAWDVLGQETLATKIARRAIDRDQIARNLKARLGVHENPPNPLEKTLSVLAMIPEVVATAALVGDQVLEMSNGGTREKRLTDVMSLGMQLDSREAALSRQSYLAASSINAGKLTGNRVLSSFAQALALQLAGQ